MRPGNTFRSRASGLDRASSFRLLPALARLLAYPPIDTARLAGLNNLAKSRESNGNRISFLSLRAARNGEICKVQENLWERRYIQMASMLFKQIC